MNNNIYKAVKVFINTKLIILLKEKSISKEENYKYSLIDYIKKKPIAILFNLKLNLIL